MNLFTKKNGLASILAVSSISLMSLSHKSEDYGQSAKVDSTTSFIQDYKKVNITCELEVPLITTNTDLTIGGKDLSRSNTVAKEQSLYNLDK